MTVYKKEIKENELIDEIYICSCSSQEHQFHLWSEKSLDIVSISISLSNYRNIFKRMAVAFGYIFGYKSRYGDFDSIILEKSDVIVLRESLNEYLKDPDQTE